MENNFRTEFKRKGYLIWRNLFDANQIDNLREKAKLVFINQMKASGIIKTAKPSEEEFEDGMVKLFEVNFDLFSNCGKQTQHLIELHQLSLEEKVVNTLKILGIEFPSISTRPVLYFNKAKLAKAEEFYKVPAHQDWRSMQGSLNSIVVWVPLVDVSKELGALKVSEGSHKLGLLETKENAWFREIMNIDLDDFNSVELQKGDALFFSSFLVHASGDNILDSIRWSCHFRYNDLNEPHFIERGYPHAYLYKPVQDLITPDFPGVDQLRKIFE